MMIDPVTLQVLLVEDEPEDLTQYERDFPAVFETHGAKAELHPCSDFGEAYMLSSSPLHRYDLIISDTYRGPAKNRDAEVLKMVNRYRGGRFCPLVVYSNGMKPEGLHEGTFLAWADKTRSGDIERAIGEILRTNIPQLAQQLHNELDRAAGSYLWGFLEKEWKNLNSKSGIDPGVLERLVRRRASMQLCDIDPTSENSVLMHRDAPEYYVYPALDAGGYKLGDIIRHQKNQGDLRVIVTPHCYLHKQLNQAKPRADHVLTIKTLLAVEVLGEKIINARAGDTSVKQKKTGQWCRSPAQTERQPEGRHWYLPEFLEIPHSFCDFLQAESVPYARLHTEYTRIATLAPPYAEAMQACFVTFFGAVGVPEVRLESVLSLFD